MNTYQAYRRQEAATGWTRIDLLLALYDGALDRLDKAEAHLRAGAPQSAASLLARVQLILSELAAGVRMDADEKMGANMLRLYEYAVHELRQVGAQGIANARQVLRTLREGFEAIRGQAIELERTGQLPSADRLRMVHATA